MWKTKSSRPFVPTIRQQDISKTFTYATQVYNCNSLLVLFLNPKIRFRDCIFVYKLKHIETQACKSKRRKVAKYLGYSFRSLRSSFGNSHDELFVDCIFNPSDRAIVKEHLLNLETLKIRFTNCRFLRRDNKLNEKLRRYWKNYQGNMIDFALFSDHFLVGNEVIRLKDLPSVIEYMIEETENGDLLQ